MAKYRTNRETAWYENNIARTHEIETECKGGIYDTDDPHMVVRLARILANVLKIREDLIDDMNGKDQSK